GLNNIRQGRSFDSLEKITLARYRSTDNARRRDNFLGNDVFANVSREYDSSLRNAEAHNWVTLSADGQTITYKQGGDGAPVNVRYALYLRKSVELFRQICRLVQVEYLLTIAARSAAT